MVKGSGRSRKKKGLKSIPQQARDFANFRGLDKQVPHASRQWGLAMDLDHSDSNGEDDEDGSKLLLSKKVRKNADSQSNSDEEEYLPSKRPLTMKKVPTGVRKVVQRDCRSSGIKNKRVPPKKQNTKMQLGRKLLDDCSGDDENDEGTSKLLLSKKNAGSQTNSVKEEYLPFTRPLTVYKVPTDVKKVVQRDRRSQGMKNKRVPPKKQKANLQLARKLLENDSSDVVSVDGNSSD